MLVLFVANSPPHSLHAISGNVAIDIISCFHEMRLQRVSVEPVNGAQLRWRTYFLGISKFSSLGASDRAFYF